VDPGDGHEAEAQAVDPQARPTAHARRHPPDRPADRPGDRLGYTRILGELKKLDIHVCRSTVVNILREASLPTGPERGEATWDHFIRSHAETLWACDFVQQRILTLKGWRDAYLLVFVNVATRRAVATRCTEHPDAAWVAEQVSSFKQQTGESGCRVLTRDRDMKFGKAFDGALRGTGITPVRLPHRAPNLNAHVERFIQSVQNECLNRFIVMGTGHLDPPQSKRVYRCGITSTGIAGQTTLNSVRWAMDLAGYSSVRRYPTVGSVRM